MAKNRIRIIVEGDAKDNGHVRLSEFLQQLESVKRALKQTERIFAANEVGVYYRIVDVTHSSPLTVVLEGAAEEIKSRNAPPVIMGKFISSLAEIRRSGRLPEKFDYAAAESYREIVAPINKHVAKLNIANGRRSIAVDQRYEEKIHQAIGPDEFSEGSLTGTLDTVRLHNTTAFEIFPTIGPRKVSCYFHPEMKDAVKQGLDRYVRVYGRLRYKHWDKFPYAIDAHKIEIYPDEKELPSLLDLKGIAPGLTGGLSTEEFLEKVRRVQ